MNFGTLTNNIKNRNNIIKKVRIITKKDYTHLINEIFSYNANNTAKFNFEGKFESNNE
jgi:hypothetical protein